MGLGLVTYALDKYLQPATFHIVATAFVWYIPGTFVVPFVFLCFGYGLFILLTLLYPMHVPGATTTCFVDANATVVNCTTTGGDFHIWNISWANLPYHTFFQIGLPIFGMFIQVVVSALFRHYVLRTFYVGFSARTLRCENQRLGWIKAYALFFIATALTGVLPAAAYQTIIALVPMYWIPTAPLASTIVAVAAQILVWGMLYLFYRADIKAEERLKKQIVIVGLCYLIMAVGLYGSLFGSYYYAIMAPVMVFAGVAAGSGVLVIIGILLFVSDRDRYDPETCGIPTSVAEARKSSVRLGEPSDDVIEMDDRV